MDGLILARVLHVLGVVLWIGGVALVTTVLLPAARARPAAERLQWFEAVERRFAAQARVTTLVTGLSGFYLVQALGAWGRFLEPAYWWMHAMLLVWVVFSVMLFVLEPLVLHRRLQERAARDPEGTFALIQRLHWLLLGLSLLAVFGAVAGSHGGLHF